LKKIKYHLGNEKEGPCGEREHPGRFYVRMAQAHGKRRSERKTDGGTPSNSKKGKRRISLLGNTFHALKRKEKY